MADWGNSGGGGWGSAGDTATQAGGFENNDGFGNETGSCNSCSAADHPAGSCPNEVQNGGERDDKCFGCGQPGHRRAECPDAGEMTCRFCKEPGHMIRDCPTKPPMMCDNCGEEGHMRKTCEKPRQVKRDHIADVPTEEAWAKIKLAVDERDSDDAKQALHEYVKSLNGNITYRQLQESFLRENIGLWLIALERPLIGIFTNMNLQGNVEQKYSISYRFSEKPERPREIEGWPQNREEILSRLDDAGEVVDSGKQKCHNCEEYGHTSRDCTQEKVERQKQVATCYNCGEEGHRVRDCPQPRKDPFACKNCGQSGHKVAECPESPNPENVECRRCNQTGHFAKDCPDAPSQTCRNCNGEGHMAKDCTEPKNMDNVTCRNCEKSGHFSRDCPEPRDYSKVQCSNCEQFGHTKVRCKEPPKEEAAETYDSCSGGDGGDGGYAAPAENSSGW